MQNKTLKSIAATGLACLMAVGSVGAFAANVNVDSIASVDKTDNGTTVGYDESQSQKTTYQDTDTDATLTADVYATQASTFEVTVPEVIILDGAYNAEGKNSGAYEVDVIGNICGDEEVIVTPDASFKMSQEGKDDLDTTVTQEKQSYTYADGMRIDTPVTGTGVVEATGMTAGQWHGAFDFAISLAKQA